ncbi:MAG: hypothetical protein RR867_08135 [Ruthenibacterium sp.]
MKGVTKRVIEIVEPQDACIERVLVFLRSDCASMRVGQKRAEAEKYVAGLVCYKRRLWPLQNKAVRIVCMVGGVILLAAAAAYFLM